MKIDLNKLVRVVVQVVAAAPVIVAAVRPVIAEIRPKASGS